MTCINFRFQVIDNSCTVLDKLSAKAWGNYSFSGGTDYVNFKNGYSSLVRSMVEELPAGTLCLNSPVVTVKWRQSISLQVESCTKLDTVCKKQSAGVVTGGTVHGDAEHKINHNGVDAVHMTATVRGDAEHKANHNGVDAVLMTGTVHGNTKHKANYNGFDVVHMTGTVRGDAEHHARYNGVDSEVVGSVEKPPVLVSCSTGATYAAGHVIVTCSLGCLKVCCRSMFEPALPDSMIQVSDREVKHTRKLWFICILPVQSRCLY